MAAAAAAAERAGADPPATCTGGADSGNVSQSHSSASGLGEPEDEDAWEASLGATAAAYSAYLLADRSLFSEQVRGRGGRWPPRRPCGPACRAPRGEGAAAGPSPAAARPVWLWRGAGGPGLSLEGGLRERGVWARWARERSWGRAWAGRDVAVRLVTGA